MSNASYTTSDPDSRLTVYNRMRIMGAMTKRAPQRSALQKWCDKIGHGARAQLARDARVRYQTIHDLFKGTRVATVDTARKIEKATKGEVPWTTLVG